jgi:hypothetical protein
MCTTLNITQKLGRRAEQCSEAHGHPKLGKTDSSREYVKWYLDLGASDDMCKDPAEINRKVAKIDITTANGIMQSKSVGDHHLLVNGEPKTILKNVLHCPEITDNLISVSRLTDEGYTIIFNKSGWRAKHKSDPKRDLSGPREGNLYSFRSGPHTHALSVKLAEIIGNPSYQIILHGKKWKARSGNKTAEGDLGATNWLLALYKKSSECHTNAMSWHKRLGHISLNEMKKVARSGAIQGFNTQVFDCSIQSLSCSSGLLGKMTKTRILLLHQISYLVK